MSDEQQQGWKRVHFFKHFLTEEDWNARHHYHMEKCRFHNQAFHLAGIVRYVTQELMVHQRTAPDLSVVVEAGYAIDEAGRDILNHEPVILRIVREHLYLPCTVYVVARFNEVPADLVRFKDGSRQNKTFQERPEIELVMRPPEEGEIELARIQLSEDVYKVTDARDPFKPTWNEIDLRGRRFGYVFRAIDRELKQKLLQAIAARRHAYLRIGGHQLLRPAAALAHSLAVLEMVVEADCLSPNALVECLDGINLMDRNLVELVRTRIDDPWVLERPEWQQFLRSCEMISTLLSGSMNYKLGNVDQILALFLKSVAHIDGLMLLYGNESLVFYEGQEVMLPKTYPMGHDWERIKVWSAEFPEILYVDGMEWKLLGELNITDEASEKRYRFQINNAIDSWRTRQSLYYPDGTRVDDTGVAHEGGFTQFELRGVVPDMHLAIIRLMDYARADFELEIIVNDQVVGVSQCLGYDRQFRWRNWPFVIPSWFVNDDVIRVRQAMTTAERDVNMFRYWFYQPVGF